MKNIVFLIVITLLLACTQGEPGTIHIADPVQGPLCIFPTIPFTDGSCVPYGSTYRYVKCYGDTWQYIEHEDSACTSSPLSIADGFSYQCNRLNIINPTRTTYTSGSYNVSVDCREYSSLTGAGPMSGDTGDGTGDYYSSTGTYDPYNYITFSNNSFCNQEWIPVSSATCYPYSDHFYMLECNGGDWIFAEFPDSKCMAEALSIANGKTKECNPVHVVNNSSLLKDHYIGGYCNTPVDYSSTGLNPGGDTASSNPTATGSNVNPPSDATTSDQPNVVQQSSTQAGGNDNPSNPTSTGNNNPPASAATSSASTPATQISSTAAAVIPPVILPGDQYCECTCCVGRKNCDLTLIGGIKGSFPGNTCNANLCYYEFPNYCSPSGDTLALVPGFASTKYMVSFASIALMIIMALFSLLFM